MSWRCSWSKKPQTVFLKPLWLTFNALSSTTWPSSANRRSHRTISSSRSSTGRWSCSATKLLQKSRFAFSTHFSVSEALRPDTLFSTLSIEINSLNWRRLQRPGAFFFTNATFSTLCCCFHQQAAEGSDKNDSFFGYSFIGPATLDILSRRGSLSYLASLSQLSLGL